MILVLLPSPGYGAFFRVRRLRNVDYLIWNAARCGNELLPVRWTPGQSRLRQNLLPARPNGRDGVKAPLRYAVAPHELLERYRSDPALFLGGARDGQAGIAVRLSFQPLPALCNLRNE